MELKYRIDAIVKINVDDAMTLRLTHIMPGI